MIKIDFEFVSTRRNRKLWPNPCMFEVPWSGSGSSLGLNASDPISNQTPIVAWTGQNINISATVISRTLDSLVVSVPPNPVSQIPNYYQGATVIYLESDRIDGSMFISQSGGLDYIQLYVKNTIIQVGNTVTIEVTPVPNTLYVPTGSDMINAYTGKYLYNETQGQYVLISGYDSVFHKVIATIPGGWSTTDNYSIRDHPPTVGNFSLGVGNTQTTVNLTGIGGTVVPGDFIRVLSTGEIVQIVSFNSITNFAIVSPSLSIVFPSGTIIELLTLTLDNYKTLSYAGTTVGQHEQVAYDINLVSASIPNKPLKNGSGGYPIDYPFLYIEFYDTNHPSQNNLYSNNHSNKSYFKVTTPIGQLVQTSANVVKFIKFTGDSSHKTIRFRPTSNFRVVWRLPSGEVIQFEEYDAQSPSVPKEYLQTAVKFNLQRD